jgi:predicted SAM-dependent methyltransferase
MDSLQEWIDEHPDKRITAITTVMYHGYHRVFSYLFVYEKR